MTSLIEEVARDFGLGTVSDVRAVAGGLSNEMWRVTTAHGDFAVKVMRVNADSPEFQSNVESAFLIEQAAYAHGVPCPEPILSSEGRCLARTRGRWVRVHRWVDGTHSVPEAHARQAAELMAAIHACTPGYTAPLEDEPWDVAGWSGLSDQPGMPADVADALRAAARTLADLENATSDPDRLDVHVGSHGDLDPKNTLLVDGTLMAVDWDAAGPRSRVREAVSLALDWTSSTREFRDVINAYRDASGTLIPAEPWVFGGWVGATGGWLVHNALHCEGSDEAQHEVARATERLLSFRAAMPEYTSALAQRPRTT